MNSWFRIRKLCKLVMLLCGKNLETHYTQIQLPKHVMKNKELTNYQIAEKSSWKTTHQDKKIRYCQV